MSVAVDVSAKALVGNFTGAKTLNRLPRACPAVRAGRVPASYRSSIDCDDTHETKSTHKRVTRLPSRVLRATSPKEDWTSRPPERPSRRDALLGLVSVVAGVAGIPDEASASVKLTPSGLDESRRFFQTFPPLWEPYFGWGSRETVCRELVPDTIWSLEQEQALDVLAMNIRCTVVKLQKTGGLVVFSPQAPTQEFFSLLDGIGKVEHVVLPTYAIEHKVWLPALARKYKDAKIWVADGLWSVPINLPNEFLGIKPSGVLVPSSMDRRFPTPAKENEPAVENEQPPWLDEMEYKVLRVDTAGTNPYIEIVFLHKASRSLLVTDLVFSIPSDPPAVIDRDRLLNLAPDDPADAPAPLTDANLRAGWAKASLVVSFLGPARQRQIQDGEFKGKLKWDKGWEQSFAKIENRLLPSPILRTLVFSKGKGPTRTFLNELVDDWGDTFDTIIPQHYDAPFAGTAGDISTAFSFLDSKDFLSGLSAPGSELPEEDMGTLLRVNDVLEFVGLGRGSE